MKTSTHRPVAIRPRATSVRRDGFSLIELLVGLVLLAIVLGGWFLICNFQAIRKEALRRVAVEEAAGMLDLMARSSLSSSASTYYGVSFDANTLTYIIVPANTMTIPMANAVPSPAEAIGYRLRTNVAQVAGASWRGQWAVIELYDKAGVTNPGVAFTRMSILMKR